MKDRAACQPCHAPKNNTLQGAASSLPNTTDACAAKHPTYSTTLEQYARDTVVTLTRKSTNSQTDGRSQHLQLTFDVESINSNSQEGE